MEFLSLLQSNQALSLSCFSILGLLVGSFLNVIIHRTPLKMVYEWRKESTLFLSNQEDIGSDKMAAIQKIVAKDTPISLSFPPSRCPHCGHWIRWYENVPVLSWLLLRAKCSSCQTPISFRYPFVEATTAILSALVILKFGVTGVGISALALVWILIALTGIDFDTQLLPDRLTYPLAGMGLMVNSQHWFVSPVQSIWGLIIGFLSLWLVVQIFYLLTKKQGMGAGDFKLLAALGAWLGVGMLPLIILLSSLIGTVVGGVLMKIQGESRPFAFGPYIAIAGLVALFFGSNIMSWYLGMYS